MLKGPYLSDSDPRLQAVKEHVRAVGEHALVVVRRPRNCWPATAEIHRCELLPAHDVVNGIRQSVAYPRMMVRGSVRVDHPSRFLVAFLFLG